MAGVVSDRLQDQRTRVVAIGISAMLLLVIGYLLGKAR
jgi:hypothetical protein